jgi:hypothetical protein
LGVEQGELLETSDGGKPECTIGAGQPEREFGASERIKIESSLDFEEWQATRRNEGRRARTGRSECR